MQWYYNLGLGRRLALSGGLVAAVIVVALLGLADTRTERNQTADTSNAIIAAQLASSAEAYIIDQDRLALQALLRDLTRHASIPFAAILDGQNRIVVESGSAGSVGPTLGVFRHPISVGDTAVGTASIQVTQADSAQFNPQVILLLGSVVFVLTGLFLQYHLHRLDHCLYRGAQQLSSLSPAAALAATTRDPLTQLQLLSEHAAERFAPPPADQPAAALALRLPALASDHSATPNPVRLGELADTVELAAAQYRGRVSGRHAGWLIDFRGGQQQLERALDCAAQLQATFQQDAWQHDWAMAIDLEALREEFRSEGLREMRWQSSCEQLYEQCTALSGLLVTRLALSAPAINQRVQVCEEDGELYRVTHIGSREEAGAAAPPAADGEDDSTAA